MGVDLFLTYAGYTMILCLLVWWSMVLKQDVIVPFSQYIFHKKNKAALIACNDVLKYVLDVIDDIVKKNFQMLVTMDASAKDMVKSQDQIKVVSLYPILAFLLVKGQLEYARIIQLI
jgi:hypothetical protein